MEYGNIEEHHLKPGVVKHESLKYAQFRNLGIVDGLIDTIVKGELKLSQAEQYRKEGKKILNKNDLEKIFSGGTMKIEEGKKQGGEATKQLKQELNLVEAAKRPKYSQSDPRYCPAQKCYCNGIEIYDKVRNVKICTRCAYTDGQAQRVDRWARCPNPERMLLTSDPYREAYIEFSEKLTPTTPDTMAEKIFCEVIKKRFKPCQETQQDS